jgi:RNA polymerase-interacting CarD/CdnL/TRCF family regulator
MSFHVGDKVIHSTHGLGEIVLIEEKPIREHSTNCYVFRANDLMVWIPIDEARQPSLRLPTTPNDFEKLFAILTGPNEDLPQDRALRRDLLIMRMRDGQLASICQVIRDLIGFKRSSKLNDQERSILERAMNSLVIEWSYSMGVSMIQAQQEMTNLLGE